MPVAQARVLHAGSRQVLGLLVALPLARVVWMDERDVGLREGQRVAAFREAHQEPAAPGAPAAAYPDRRYQGQASAGSLRCPS